MSTRTSSGSTTQSGSKQQQTPHTTQACLPHDKIAMRAYHKWVQRGCPQGTDRQDWLEAEAELKAETSKTSAPQGQKQGR